MLNPNVPAWFEIPVADIERAQAFYENALGVALRRERIGDTELAVFPYGGKPLASGALMAQAGYTPSLDGTLVYLSVENLSTVLERTNQLGATTLVPRTALPPGMGWFAQFRDSEGNRVGLWSAA